MSELNSECNNPSHVGLPELKDEFDFVPPPQFRQIHDSPKGSKCRKVLSCSVSMTELFTFTRNGLPAAAALNVQTLRFEFPGIDDDDHLKQYFGVAIRKLHEKKGYHLDRLGIKIKRQDGLETPIFTSAARYARIKGQTPEDGETSMKG